MKKFETLAITLGHVIFLFVFLCSAESSTVSEVDSLIDQLTIALASHDKVAIQKVSQELIQKGDTILPAIKKNLNSQNRDLKFRVIGILKEIKTDNSSKLLVQIMTDEQEKMYLIFSMEILQNRDLSFDVNQKTIDKIQQEIVRNELAIAPKAARILGRMKQVNPETRVPILLTALVREIKNQNANVEKKLLPNSYATEPQYKIRQLVYAVSDIGKPAIPCISKELENAGAADREYLLICLGLCGDKTVAGSLEKILLESADGLARSLAALAIGNAGGKETVESLKKALADPFCVSYQTDLVRGDGRKAEVYPVREAAAAALNKLGVSTKRQGNDFTIKD